MTTLYRLAKLICLGIIAYSLWKISQKDFVANVTSDSPSSDYIKEEERKFAERQLKRQENNRNEFEDRQRARKLGMQ